ncbi:MAG: twin-arginine translocase TatA/TatE family subunit [Planctomycetes bacterium]|nr:twin-arginine translocase TatA/TatE family subunit [Planctomycetota bacterium]
MGFIKEWWHWLLLAIVILFLLGIRFLVISGKISEADKVRRTIKSNAEQAENLKREIDDKTLPTAGDLQESEKLQEQLEVELEKTENLWKHSSLGLEESHNQSPTYFANFLYEKCEDMCWKLAQDISRLRGVPEEVIEKSRPGTSLSSMPKEVMEKMYWPCNPVEHRLAEYLDATAFKNKEDTETPWIRYLISRRIHEIVGKTSVEINTWKIKKVEDNDPVKELSKQQRTIDQLGQIDFSGGGDFGLGASASSRGGRSRYGEQSSSQSLPLPGKDYYKVYTVNINVVGHLRVIQELMKNFLNSEDILFVLKNTLISRYEDKETQSGAVIAGANRQGGKGGGMIQPPIPAGVGGYDISGGMQVPGRIPSVGGQRDGGLTARDRDEASPWPSSLDLSLRVDHEPPVEAILSYEVYRFGDFKEKKESIEDGTGY